MSDRTSEHRLNSADKVDVVIPVKDEEALLGACLRSVLWDAAGLDLRIIVVANGCTDRSAEVARGLRPVAVEMGHELIVVVTDEVGKSAALNLAAAHERGVTTVFLDGDTVLLPGCLRALASFLRSSRRPLLAAPRPLLVRPQRRGTRSFAAVWTRLPAVEGDVVGAGCYAVNAAGRARWTRFPPVTADDAFVRGRFARAERHLLQRAAFLLVLPEGRELRRVVRRWRRGNNELAQSNPSAGLRRNIAWGLTRPSLWLHMPAFVAAHARAALERGGGWAQARRLRAEVAADTRGGRPTVQAIVVTLNNRADARECLSRIRSRVADVEVSVVDNGSRDGTVAQLEMSVPNLSVHANDRNIGFAAAVNQAAAQSRSDYLLLVNADAMLEPDAIDQLLALAARFPQAGLYGGRAVDENGALDPYSCLGAPSVRQALAFAALIRRIPGVRLLDPDLLGDTRRSEVRPVPALTGTCLLIDRRVWRRVGGFDERYFVYGEDVDLCLRATRSGASPMYSPLASYRHRGAASSQRADHLVMLLAGKTTLYARHLGRRRRAIARLALVAGVALRASIVCGAARLTHVPEARAAWIDAWRRRTEWAQGWTAELALSFAREAQRG